MSKRVIYDGPISDPFKCPYRYEHFLGIAWDFQTRYECRKKGGECTPIMHYFGETEFPKDCPLKDCSPYYNDDEKEEALQDRLSDTLIWKALFRIDDKNDSKKGM